MERSVFSGPTASRILALAMSQRSLIVDWMDRRQHGGNSLLKPCCAMSEVQICGIPKLSVGEVASTP
jgi:hypothetical protein